jgi:hypothetical protein
MEFEVSTCLETRLGVSWRQLDAPAIAGFLNRRPLTVDDPELADLTAFALDEDWALNLLAQPDVKSLLGHLFSGESSSSRRQITLRPGWIQLRFFGSRRALDFTFDVDARRAEQWLLDLIALVALAERIPEPMVKDEPSSAEQMLQSMRDRSPYLVPAIALAVIAIFVLCAGGAGLVAFLLAAAQ